MSEKCIWCGSSELVASTQTEEIIEDLPMECIECLNCGSKMFPDGSFSFLVQDKVYELKMDKYMNAELITESTLN